MMRHGTRPGWRAPAITLLLLAAAAPAAAQVACPAGQDAVSLGPTYIDDVDGGRALGAAGAAVWCSAGYDTRPRFPRVRYSGMQAKAIVPFSRLTLPQNLEASAWIGYTLALTERAPDTGGLLDEAESAFLFDYGALAVGGRVQYESSTDFAEQAVLGGIEVRWVNPHWRLAPSTVLTLNAVRPVSSETRDTLGVDPAVHGRLGVRGYWLAPLGRWLELEVDVAYFFGFGMDDVVADAGFDQGAFIATDLGLVVDWPVGGVRLERIFVGYAHGQQPTDGQERKAWTLGARFGTRR
jgi:hypothetical protein